MNIKTPSDALERLSGSAFSHAKKAPVHIVLDNVRSAQNVGSVFRTMDAFRCAKLHICGISAKPPHREINKTALGATETVEWEYYDSTTLALTALKANGVKLFAVEQTSKSHSLRNFKCDHDAASAFIFGNEVDGVQQEIVDLCHGSIELPQHGSKHSLNVSVCAGIVIWHVTAGFNYWNGLPS